MTSISCSICLDDFTFQTEQVTLSCGHVYHKTCVHNWLQENSVCPECRSGTADESIRSIYLHFGETSIVEHDRRKQKKIESLEKCVDDLKKKFKTEEKTKRDYKLKYGNVDAELIQRTKEVEEKEKQVAELKQKLSALENELKANTEDQHSNRRDRLSQVLKELEASKKEIDELNATCRQNTGLEHKLIDLENQLKTKEEQIANLHSQSTNKERSLMDELIKEARRSATLEERLNHTTKAGNDVKEKLAEKERRIYELENDVDNRRDFSSKATYQLEQLKTEHSALKSKIQSLEKANIALPDILIERETLENELEEMAAAKMALELKVKDMEIKLAQLNTDLANQSKTSREMQHSLVSLQQYNEQVTKVATLEERMAQNHTKLVEADREKTILSNEVERLRNQCSKLALQLENAKSNQAEITKLQNSTISSFSETIRDVESQQDFGLNVSAQFDAFRAPQNVVTRSRKQLPEQTNLKQENSEDFRLRASRKKIRRLIPCGRRSREAYNSLIPEQMEGERMLRSESQNRSFKVTLRRGPNQSYVCDLNM